MPLTGVGAPVVIWTRSPWPEYVPELELPRRPSAPVMSRIACVPRVKDPKVMPVSKWLVELESM